MNVFLIGATGYVGAVAAEKLLAAGRRVVGLARTSSAATELLRRGITPLEHGSYRGPSPAGS